MRVACLVLVIVFMALLLNNFYVNGGGHCSWCRYLRYTLESLSLESLSRRALFLDALAFRSLGFGCDVGVVFLLVTNDSCLPVNGWCDLGNIQTTTTNNPSRMFL